MRGLFTTFADRGRPKAEEPSTVQLHQLYRDYIKHEDDLINQRTTWFIQLHSFLIAAYGVAFVAIVSSFNFTNVDPLVADCSRALGALFLFAITCVGMSSALSASRSVAAASHAIDTLARTGNALIGGRPDGHLFPRLTWGGADPGEYADGLERGWSERTLRRGAAGVQKLLRLKPKVVRPDYGADLGLLLPKVLGVVWRLSFVFVACVGYTIFLARQHAPPKPALPQIAPRVAVSVQGAITLTDPATAVVREKTAPVAAPPAAKAKPSN